MDGVILDSDAMLAMEVQTTRAELDRILDRRQALAVKALYAFYRHEQARRKYQFARAASLA